MIIFFFEGRRRWMEGGGSLTSGRSHGATALLPGGKKRPGQITVTGIE